MKELNAFGFDSSSASRLPIHVDDKGRQFDRRGFEIVPFRHTEAASASEIEEWARTNKVTIL